ncbi:MAG: Thiopurine S-methyltransferase [Verrucomicrobia subdivision 3 bacterium]|nr:Thiopurine S-methyltransferase [Limisphaerales bacterium]MCS1413615.1 Thiopurine S-methyltransferase [Limisphaerales bacterium]
MDWEDCYQKNECPWDKGSPSPGLVDFLEAECGLVPGTVCVPGCGSGHDVREWVRHKFHATGFDISPTAVELAKTKMAEANVEADFQVADFLAETPSARFDWVFEHTFFCAIQPEQRDRYVESVLRWLKPGGDYLAVYYLLQEDGGPPFPSDQDEIMERFTPKFNLKREWVPRSYPNRTNLELMAWWTPKP